jgi:hypothetical protein
MVRFSIESYKFPTAIGCGRLQNSSQHSSVDIKEDYENSNEHSR